MNIVIQEYIAVDPKIRAGRPVIAGTGIRVMDIVALKNYHEYTIEAIADNYGLSLSQVYAALAYYYDHQTEIDSALIEDDEYIQKAKEAKIGNENPLLP
ncbi:MAG: DUF433 domain-containing protein [Anaerolineae bacterium]|nr:DUF433 domain-containing protein [Anaerolineae bacterium]